MIRDAGTPHGAAVERGVEEEILLLPGHTPVRLTPDFVDPGVRLAALDAMGVTTQVLSLSPPMVHWAPPELGRDLAAAFNEALAGISRAHPGRLVGAATLPLQDVTASLDEARRAVRLLGLRGLCFGTSVCGRYLDAPEFESLWAVAEELGVPVFIHPLSHLRVDGSGRYHMLNMIGWPIETAVLAARLITSGLFDRHPHLRVVLAHGGGVFPLLVARLDHGLSVRPEWREGLRERPSAYLRHFYFDTITHGEPALRFLAEIAGPAHLVMGSDMPYPMSEPDPVGMVRRLGLPEEAVRMILGGTAAGLLGLNG